MSSISVTVSERALAEFQAAQDQEELSDHGVRMTAQRINPVKLRYGLEFASAEDKQADDIEVTVGEQSLKVWIDPDSAKLLDGAKVDFIEGPGGTGFKFDNPNENVGWHDPVADKLQKLLDEEINPSIAAHGGKIDLLDFKDGKAYVFMGGGCQGCGMAAVTLREGVDARVKEKIPEIKELIDTTDHNAGANPYYA